MLIELVDDLRCPRPHEETWLVASTDRTVGRDIVDGTLGCPICHAEYRIRDGVVSFAGPGGVASSRGRAAVDVDPELALRLAAFLDLSDAQGLALLTGTWGTAATHLRSVVPTHLVVLNPTSAVAAGNGVSVLEAERIPLADSTCRGVALDDSHAETYLDDAVRALRPRGRLVASASTPIPEGVSELARDERLWVAERAPAAPRLVMLQSRGT